MYRSGLKIQVDIGPKKKKLAHLWHQAVTCCRPSNALPLAGWIDQWCKLRAHRYKSILHGSVAHFKLGTNRDIHWMAREGEKEVQAVPSNTLRGWFAVDSVDATTMAWRGCSRLAGRACRGWIPAAELLPKELTSCSCTILTGGGGRSYSSTPPSIKFWQRGLGTLDGNFFFNQW
jgi:hypothetical protein